MGFYIDIIMDKDVIFSENPGLADVIRYIGQKESKVSLSDSDALENGVRIVDKRLNRFHKKAIRRLIHSELKSFKCVGDEVKNKNVYIKQLCFV